MMQAHYTSILDLSQEALEAAEKGYQRLLEGYKRAQSLEAQGKTSTFNVSEWVERCYAAMNDDFNTPILIAQLFEGVKQINLLHDQPKGMTSEDLELLRTTIGTFTFDVLGLKDESQQDAGHFEKLSGVVELLIAQRNKARERKDFATSDQIRDELARLGIQLKDSKEGTTFSLS